MFLVGKCRPLPTTHAYVCVLEERHRTQCETMWGFASQTKVREGENNTNNKTVKLTENLQYSKYQS